MAGNVRGVSERGYRTGQHTGPSRGVNKSAGKRRKARRKVGPIKDYSLIFVVFLLLAFGLVMLYSTSSYKAALSSLTHYDGAYYLKRQMASSALGLFFMAVLSRVPDYRWWRKYSWFVYIFATVLLLMIIPFGTMANGAKRWIYFGPISVQPAEVSKIAVILLTASLIDRSKKAELQKFKHDLKMLVPAIVQAGMIYFITSNLSSAIIVMAIASCMVFVSNRKYARYLLFIVGGVVLVAGLVMYIVKSEEKRISEAQNVTVVTASANPQQEEDDEEGMGFRGRRVLAWLDPEKYSDETGFQTLQALYGIGSGGMIGKGLGQSMQKLGFIPEAQNDMIFSIICEELGMFGALAIISMFVILCWRLMVIATNARDLYGGLITVGIMSHIAVQVVLNIAVVTNVIPNTGVSLPFISYGGTSVLFLLSEIGLALNVSRKI